MKYWEILLCKQRERGRDGLTLPFLIGAQNYLPEAHNRQDINDIIHEMVTNNTFVTCIRFCMGIETLIFEKGKKENDVYSPTYNQQNQGGLSVAKFLKNDLGESIELLIERMKEKYQKVIDDQLFSAEPNVDAREPNWTAFNEKDDIQFIKESFKSLKLDAEIPQAISSLI